MGRFCMRRNIATISSCVFYYFYRKMEKSFYIKENRIFAYTYKKGKKMVYPLFIIYFRPNRTDSNRVGITVSKKNGKRGSPQPIQAYNKGSVQTA